MKVWIVDHNYDYFERKLYINRTPCTYEIDSTLYYIFCREVHMIPYEPNRDYWILGRDDYYIYIN